MDKNRVGPLTEKTENELIISECFLKTYENHFRSFHFVYLRQVQKSIPYLSLVSQLDRFVRKFYTNELLRGAIFSAIYVLIFFQAINLLEYYLFLPSVARKVLFWGFVLSSVAVVFAFVILPLLKIYRLGKTISYEQASVIIGEHFTEVKDKLLNVLQLKQNETSNELSLVNASINQKIQTLSPITFSSAIDLQQNKKYLPYLLPPLLLFLGIILVSPQIFKQGTTRLYNSNKVFEKEAPFRFVVKNKSLQTQQYENFELLVTTEGNVLPSELFLEIDGNQIKLKEEEKNQFLHTFSNVQKDIHFHFSANGFSSKEYVLKVAAKPVIKQYVVEAKYPPYTGKQNETLVNAGDLSVPAGTQLTWKIKTQNVAALQFRLGDTLVSATEKSENEFVFTKRFLSSNAYSLHLSSNEIANADSMKYFVNVIPDLYPQIAVTEKRDSLNDRYFYYLGEISDDYGLKKLTFNYQITRAETNAPQETKSLEVSINPGVASRFQFFWNVNEIGLQPEDKMVYYFEVWDNDGVNGSKSTKSATMKFSMLSENQMQKELETESKAIKEDLKQSMKEAKALQKAMTELQNKMLEKKNLTWEDKKAIQDLLEKQKALQQQLNEMKQQFANNVEKQKEFKQQSEAIQEKMEQLQELFNSVMSDEMKKMQAQLEKMLDELQKKEAIEKMDQMKAGNEKTEKELDRMLELMKKLELEQKVQEVIDKLNKLAEKQEKLAEQVGQKNEQDKQLEEKQQKLKEDFQQAKKDVKDIEQKSKEADTEAKTDEAQKEMDKAEQDLNDAEQDLQKQDNQSASKNQKSAAKNMKSAADKLAQMQQKMQQEQQAEDMATLRQLLKNILTISFDQEKLMAQLKTININNPKYPDMMKEQARIRENSEMVEDSLYALAKRVFKIKSFVTKQITEINRNLNLSISEMEARNTYKAGGNQQFVMTGLNNLALMLSETQQQMQMSQQSGDPKDGSPKMMCNKPGGGKPNMSQMQKQLGDKISQLAEQMKKDGQNPNGQQQGQGNKKYSKEFAEMAAQQAALRNMLQQLEGQENKDGKGSLGNLGDLAKKMEKNETDLVNKRITGEMLRRQQEISVRLLEVEKAQRERGEKEERESNAGKELLRQIPPSLENYLKQQRNATELYKTVPPTLKPFYKGLSEKYFKTITTN